MINPLENTLTRVMIYALSQIITIIPAFLAGLVVINPEAMTLTVNLHVLATTVVAGLGLSGGIFAKWGKR